MARTLHTDVTTEIQRDLVRPVLLYEGEFSTGTARFWSGVGELSWSGQTWLGTGMLGAVSPIEETSEVRAAGVTVSLAGLATETVALALAAARQGKPGRVWVAFLDSAGAIVGDPVLAFSGRLDVPSIEDAGESATIVISYESRLIDLDRPRERRYTHEDQQMDYPGDLGFEYVAGLQDKPITWR